MCALIPLAHQLQVRAKDVQKNPELCPSLLTYLTLHDLPESGLNSTVEKVVKPPAEKNREESFFSSEAAAEVFVLERETLEMWDIWEHHSHTNLASSFASGVTVANSPACNTPA